MAEPPATPNDRSTLGLGQPQRFTDGSTDNQDPKLSDADDSTPIPNSPDSTATSHPQPSTDRNDGDTPPPTMPAKIRDYELIGPLGEGSMGVVWRAWHVPLRRQVALKLVKTHADDPEETIARFRREIRVVGKLEHPHLVSAYDAGQVGDQWYLAMTLIEGQNLKQLVRTTGPLPVPDACEVIRQAALGMQHAHELGLVHRDLKPGNLMLTRLGRVKVVDLGLARAARVVTPHDQQALPLTGLAQPSHEGEISTANQVLGTPDYLAPELWKAGALADVRSDLYALGCTLFFILTGQAVFSGEDYTTIVDIMKGHVFHPVPTVQTLRPDVPDELEDIIARLLEKDPQRRFSTAAALAQALAPFCTGSKLKPLIDKSLPANNEPQLDQTGDFDLRTTHRNLEFSHHHPPDDNAPAFWTPLKAMVLGGISLVLLALILVFGMKPRLIFPVEHASVPKPSNTTKSNKTARKTVPTPATNVPIDLGFRVTVTHDGQASPISLKEAEVPPYSSQFQLNVSCQRPGYLYVYLFRNNRPAIQLIPPPQQLEKPQTKVSLRYPPTGTPLTKNNRRTVLLACWTDRALTSKEQQRFNSVPLEVAEATASREWINSYNRPIEKWERFFKALPYKQNRFDTALKKDSPWPTAKTMFLAVPYRSSGRVEEFTQDRCYVVDGSYRMVFDPADSFGDVEFRRVLRKRFQAYQGYVFSIRD